MDIVTYWNVGDYICTSMDTNYRIGLVLGIFNGIIT
jgi:hypothetical protein